MKQPFKGILITLFIVVPLIVAAFLIDDEPVYHVVEAGDPVHNTIRIGEAGEIILTIAETDSVKENGVVKVSGEIVWNPGNVLQQMHADTVGGHVHTWSFIVDSGEQYPDGYTTDCRPLGSFNIGSKDDPFRVVVNLVHIEPPVEHGVK